MDLDDRRAPDADGVTNGAIYALLALALVLVFAVTRVIFVPPGEFVAFGALTLAMLQQGNPRLAVAAYGCLARLALAAGHDGSVAIDGARARREGMRLRALRWAGATLALPRRSCWCAAAQPRAGRWRRRWR